MSVTLKFSPRVGEGKSPPPGWRVGDLCAPSAGTDVLRTPYRVTDIGLNTITLDTEGLPQPALNCYWLCHEGGCRTAMPLSLIPLFPPLGS